LLVDLANHFAQHRDAYTYDSFFFSFREAPHYGVIALLLASISVAMFFSYFVQLRIAPQNPKTP
jgi:hypothetical protein